MRPRWASPTGIAIRSPSIAERYFRGRAKPAADRSRARSGGAWRSPPRTWAMPTLRYPPGSAARRDRLRPSSALRARQPLPITPAPRRARESACSAGTDPSGTRARGRALRASRSQPRRQGSPPHRRAPKARPRNLDVDGVADGYFYAAETRANESGHGALLRQPRMDRGCAGTIQTVGYQDRDAAGADAAVARARKERQRRGRLGCPGEKKEEITRSPGLFAEYALTSRMNSQKTPLTAAPSEGPRP